MLKITVERSDGRVEAVERDLSPAYAQVGSPPHRNLVEANRAQGVRVLAVEYIPQQPEPLTLQEQREQLMDSIITSPRNDAEWRHRADAIEAVAAFDAAHPEVLAEAQARHAERMQQSFIARGLD